MNALGILLSIRPFMIQLKALRKTPNYNWFEINSVVSCSVRSAKTVILKHKNTPWSLFHRRMARALEEQVPPAWGLWWGEPLASGSRLQRRGSDWDGSRGPPFFLAWEGMRKNVRKRYNGPRGYQVGIRKTQQGIGNCKICENKERFTSSKMISVEIEMTGLLGSDLVDWQKKLGRAVWRKTRNQRPGRRTKKCLLTVAFIGVIFCVVVSRVELSDPLGVCDVCLF